MRVRHFAVMALLLLSMSASASAAIDFGNAFGRIGENIRLVLQNQYIVYSASFILFFILLYCIFAVGLRKVKVFSEGETIRREGKMAAVALALLGSMGVFYFFGSVEEAIRRVDGTMGWIAGVAFAAMIFGITYFNLKTTESGKLSRGAAWFAAGLALLVYGMFSENKNAMDWGAVVLLVTAIWAGISALGGRKRTGEGGAEPNEHVPRGEVPDERDKRRSPRAPIPSQVRGFQGEMTDGSHPIAHLAWRDNPQAESVERYDLRRRMGRSMQRSWLRRMGSSLYRDFVAGWHHLPSVSGTHYEDADVVSYMSYEYAVRAVNNAGNSGSWATCFVQGIARPPPVLPTRAGAPALASINHGRPVDNTQGDVHDVEIAGAYLDNVGNGRILDRSGRPVVEWGNLHYAARDAQLGYFTVPGNLATGSYELVLENSVGEGRGVFEVVNHGHGPIAAEIVRPARDAPDDQSAVKRLGDKAALEVIGRIDGVPGRNYHLFFGVYDANQNIRHDADMTRPRIQGSEAQVLVDVSRLPVGEYWVYLFAQLEGGMPAERPPDNADRIPNTMLIVGRARRRIIVYEIKVELAEPRGRVARPAGSAEKVDVVGKVSGPHPGYDYIFGLYSNNPSDRGALRIKLPSFNNVKQGESQGFSFDVSKLSVGNYAVCLFTQIPGTGAVEPPGYMQGGPESLRIAKPASCPVEIIPADWTLEITHPRDGSVLDKAKPKEFYLEARAEGLTKELTKNISWSIKGGKFGTGWLFEAYPSHEDYVAFRAKDCVTICGLDDKTRKIFEDGQSYEVSVKAIDVNNQEKTKTSRISVKRPEAEFPDIRNLDEYRRRLYTMPAPFFISQLLFSNEIRNIINMARPDNIRRLEYFWKHFKSTRVLEKYPDDARALEKHFEMLLPLAAKVNSANYLKIVEAQVRQLFEGKGRKYKFMDLRKDRPIDSYRAYRNFPATQASIEQDVRRYSLDDLRSLADCLNGAYNILEAIYRKETAR